MILAFKEEDEHEETSIFFFLHIVMLCGIEDSGTHLVNMKMQEK